MHIKDATGPAGHHHRHHARLKLKIGRRSVLRADVAISSSGLLAIGGLVSSILLSTAVIVQVAKDRRGSAPARPDNLPFRP
ncbi:hypothetical protein [Sphingomonas sp. UBA978]|jgi:hypothetical protein|uniref:hypothetical protein n=1 Tax=Sphingomonas sp. UBA978 TaxID=1947536 RepID=UPI0025E9E1E3|nr:hypothetical protein [Sphingomonas sp. UBA978]